MTVGNMNSVGGKGEGGVCYQVHIHSNRNLKGDLVWIVTRRVNCRD